MGVTFGFQAFKNRDSGSIDYIEDSGKTLTNEILGTVPDSLENAYASNNPELVIHEYNEYFRKMQGYGFLEEDLDFLIYRNHCAYNGKICNHYFMAEDCYNKFIKFTNYFKDEERAKKHSLLLDLDTKKYIYYPVMIGGQIEIYEFYHKEYSQKHLDAIFTAIWNTELNCWQADKPLNCEIVDVTLYEYCKETIDAIADFFLKHAKEKNLIQGHWD